VLPFFIYVGLFLLLPTVIIVVGSFRSLDGGLTLSNFSGIDKPFMVKAFTNSLVVSSISAVAGAILGAVLAYAVVTGNPNGFLRRVIMSASGVLAQFGGVALAFAFIATIGTVGFVYVFLKDHGIDIYANSVWFYEPAGITLIYLYFQIPLMVLVFLPALDGIRPQWREATESLGGSTWRSTARAGVPRLHAPSVRERVFRIRDDRRPADQRQRLRALADPGPAHRRDRAVAARPGAGARAGDGLHSRRRDGAVRLAAATHIEMAPLA
jgi:putative spermidine/putrescine transport system permease protein